MGVAKSEKQNLLLLAKLNTKSQTRPAKKETQLPKQGKDVLKRRKQLRRGSKTASMLINDCSILSRQEASKELESIDVHMASALFDLLHTTECSETSSIQCCQSKRPSSLLSNSSVSRIISRIRFAKESKK